MNKTFLITGSAGFIGFHLSKMLLKSNNKVIGVDCLTDYYDIKLKQARIAILKSDSNFIEEKIDITNEQAILKVFKKYNPNIVVHLAAQAGVRYSIENPRSYLDSNIVGTFNILEGIRHSNVEHTLIASTSSIYGSNKNMPYDAVSYTHLTLPTILRV